MKFEYNPLKIPFTINREPQTRVVIPAPPSVNKLWVNAARKKAGRKEFTSGRVKTDAYKLWIKAAKDALWNQKFKTFDTPVAVMYSFNVPDNRIRDCGNYEKALSDFLVRIGILKDDHLIRQNMQQWMDNGCDWDGKELTVEVCIFSLT